MNNLTHKSEQDPDDQVGSAYKSLVDMFNKNLDALEKRHPTIRGEFQFRFDDPTAEGVRRLALVRVYKEIYHKEAELPDFEKHGVGDAARS